MLNKRYIKSIKRDIFVLISFPVFLFQFLFCYILERKDKKWFKRFEFLSNFFCFDFFSGKIWKRNVPSGVQFKCRNVNWFLKSDRIVAETPEIRCLRTSMGRTSMARLPRLIRTRF